MSIFRGFAPSFRTLAFLLAIGTISPVMAEPVQPARAVVKTQETIGTLTGQGTLVRGTQQSKLTADMAPTTIVTGDHVLLSSGEQSTFAYNDGRKIKFAGEGEYVPQTNEIKIIRGGVIMSFSSSPKGYKVRLPSATLGIRGTILDIKVLNNYEAVWVREGIIDFKAINGEKRVLKQGDGMKIERGQVAPISNTPLPGDISITYDEYPGAAAATETGDLPIDSGVSIKDPFSDNSTKVTPK